MVMIVHVYTICDRLGWDTLPVADPSAIDCGGRMFRSISMSRKPQFCQIILFA